MTKSEAVHLQIQEATDAMALRSRINECFELASLPHTTVEQRRKLLTFCVARHSAIMQSVPRIVCAVVRSVPWSSAAGNRNANVQGSLSCAHLTGWRRAHRRRSRS